MIPKTHQYIFHQGQEFQVEFYFTAKGAMPAKEYLEDRDITREVKVKLATLVKRIAEVGRLFDKEKFNLEDERDKIYAFKPFQYRFFCFFYVGGKIILTNAYMKKSQKVSQQDLECAKNYKADYLRRVKEGTYYETR